MKKQADSGQQQEGRYIGLCEQSTETLLLLPEGDDCSSMLKNPHN